MKSVTIRGIEPDLAEKLKQAAKQKELSVNQFLLNIMRQHLGLQKKKRFTLIHHDLDHLFGKWSEDEFRQIQEKIDSERNIDKELWQ
jgi:uncharacterized protein (DUF1778 family)